jgi:hypothetical protein
MSLHDDPSMLVIPIGVRFPTTDYSTKLLLARNWVRKRHPDGPVAVYAVASKRDRVDPEKARLIRETRTLAIPKSAWQAIASIPGYDPPDVRGFMIPTKDKE